MRLRYLKEHRPIVWAKLVMDGELYSHLLEVEDAANDLLDSMMPGMAKEAGATEELKARDPMRWVGVKNAPVICWKNYTSDNLHSPIICGFFVIPVLWWAGKRGNGSTIGLTRRGAPRRLLC